MSIGYGASCRLVFKDENFFAYEYTSYNLNLDNYKKARNTFDGTIIVSKDFFPKPIIVRKRRKKPNGKKEWIEKKEYPEVNYVELYNKGKIIIENSSHCWELTKNGIDTQALKLLFYLNIEYQEKGEIPEKLGIFS